MRWIKCSDRLPEPGQSVLMWGPGGFGGVAWRPDSPTAPSGVWEDERGYFDEMFVTHWMPLPSGPNGEPAE